AVVADHGRSAAIFRNLGLKLDDGRPIVSHLAPRHSLRKPVNETFQWRKARPNNAQGVGEERMSTENGELTLPRNVLHRYHSSSFDVGVPYKAAHPSLSATCGQRRTLPFN